MTSIFHPLILKNVICSENLKENSEHLSPLYLGLPLVSIHHVSHLSLSCTPDGVVTPDLFLLHQPNSSAPPKMYLWCCGTAVHSHVSPLSPDAFRAQKSLRANQGSQITFISLVLCLFNLL